MDYAWVDVSYEPSNVEVIDDDDNVFVYQLMAGVAYQFNDQMALSFSLRYRDYEEATVDSSLLPAEFDIELDEMVYDVGIRYSF
ncbi:MAG: outer membrane protein [Cellvibrionaceae bacterium]